MDMKDLRSRLDSIKKHTEEKGAAEGISGSDKISGVRPDPGTCLLDNGWNRISDMVYEKVSVIKTALPDVISDILADEAVEKIIPWTSGIPSSRLVFYDTETTGLSAGAGNIVFLTGFGEAVPGDDKLRITQLFLSDFPGEPAYLDRMKDFISPEQIYVSYNGKSFDANVLRSRFAMNGKQAEFGPQLDLLYPSRRLWKNIIGSCSLGDIESRILDKRRALDVPGFMVPDLYFDFIRSCKWETIAGVIAHHLEDIASLAELLSLQEQLFSEAGQDQPDAPPADHNYTPTEFFDPLGMASILADKRPDTAAAVLERSFKAGNVRAGMELSLICKRNSRWDEAVLIWRRMWEESRSIFAGIELAKYHEHRTHDLVEALRLTVELLSLERFRILPYKKELEKRKNRLREKISRK